MNSKKTIQKILIGLAIAVVLLIAYAVVNKSDTSDISTSTLSSLRNIGAAGDIQETDTALKNAEILKVLGSVQGIELNDEIFINPVFRLLVDSRFTIPKPLRIGRPNPFLPIGFDAIAQSGSTNSGNTGGSQFLTPVVEENQNPFGDVGLESNESTTGDVGESENSDFFEDFQNTDTQ